MSMIVTHNVSILVHLANVKRKRQEHERHWTCTCTKQALKTLLVHDNNTNSSCMNIPALAGGVTRALECTQPSGGWDQPAKTVMISRHCTKGHCQLPKLAGAGINTAIINYSACHLTITHRLNSPARNITKELPNLAGVARTLHVTHHAYKIPAHDGQMQAWNIHTQLLIHKHANNNA